MSAALLPDPVLPLLPLEAVVWTNADRLSGAPCFRHSRVPIKALFDYLEGGETVDTFLNDFDGVSRAQVLSALHYGKAQLLPFGVPQPTGKPIRSLATPTGTHC